VKLPVVAELTPIVTPSIVPPLISASVMVTCDSPPKVTPSISPLLIYAATASPSVPSWSI